MSDSVRPHRQQPTRLPHPWDSPGKTTGVDCHFLQRKKVKSESVDAQSCPTLSDPMDCSLPGSTVHGIFQARVLEWVAIAFSDICVQVHVKLGFSGGTSGEEPGWQCRRRKRCGFSPWLGKIPWRRAWQPTPVFLPGESQGQGRSPVGYGLLGCIQLNTTEVTWYPCTCIIICFISLGQISRRGMTGLYLSVHLTF